jgi:hypothetical protein
VINEWGQETGIFIPAFLKYGGTWESSGVPNIELAMMQLSTLEKLWKQTLSHACRNTGIPITLEEVFTIKGSNIFSKIRYEQLHTKDHGEEALDGSA